MSWPPLELTRQPTLGRGFRFNLFVVVIGTSVAPALGAAPHFLSAAGQRVREKQSSLVVAKVKGPGWWRSEGVRGGAVQDELGTLGDSGDMADAGLAVNTYTSGMEKNFDLLDNLEPVAPMDRLTTAKGRSSMFAGDYGGYPLNPVYVPKYLNPDAFPVTSGEGCNCTMPTKPNENITCACGDKKGDDKYTWLKDTPITGTNQYTLEPADITYPAGNYWAPEVRDTLVAPADALPLKKYPNQAIGDRIWPIPSVARENTIPVRFARYIDQVHERGTDCTDPKKCNEKCRPGDEVVANIGNLVFQAKIIKTFSGDAAQIEFTPAVGPEDYEKADCPLEAHCTAFRYCKSDKKGICTVAKKDKQRRDWAGTLRTKYSCPPFTKVCKTINTMVSADLLTKGGKKCMAAAPNGFADAAAAANAAAGVKDD